MTILMALYSTLKALSLRDSVLHCSRFFHLRSRIDARGHGVRDAPVELSARVHCDDSTSLSLVNLWDQLAFVLEHISFRSDAEATATLKRLCSVLYPTLQEFELQCNSIDALSPSVDRRASLVVSFVLM